MADPSPPLVLRLARAAVALAVDLLLLAWGMGGFAAVFAAPRALALLAIWGAAGVTLTLTRPTRGQDTTRTEKDPFAMLLLAIIPLGTPALSAWGARTGTWLLPAPEALGWLGVALSALGLYMRVAAMLQLGTRFSPLLAVQREHALETTGWYAVVRHPGYLGALLANLGASIAFGSALALPAALVMVVVQADRVRREERLLAGHFGEVWQAYARRTGALLPRLFGAR
ncbi:MAG: isoprenylcysteine carboxylmethyltransferase family protein [Candidatus Eisenbacteria bacterium]